MADKQKPDVTLSDGREVTFDLFAITKKEYDALFDRDQPDDEEAYILAKVSGLDPDDFDDMPLGDWKRFFQAFLARAADPVAEDPKN